MLSCSVLVYGGVVTTLSRRCFSEWPLLPCKPEQYCSGSEIKEGENKHLSIMHATKYPDKISQCQKLSKVNMHHARILALAGQLAPVLIVNNNNDNNNCNNNNVP